MSLNRYVALDRDGTIIVERNYLSDPNDVKLLPGVVSGLKRLSKLGLKLIVVTNQSGIGRGFFDEARLGKIHRRMCQLLARDGIQFDGIFHCPHTPDDRCECRKPMTGLLDRATVEMALDPMQGFVIGDKPCDVDLGRRVGATTFLVRSGYGAAIEAEGGTDADYVVNDVEQASRVIAKLVSRSRRKKELGIAT